MGPGRADPGLSPAATTFYVYLFPISQLILSTLYLRFHYVVDLVAGAALAVFGCYAIPRIERRFTAWQGPARSDPEPGPTLLPWAWPPLVRYVRSRFELWPYLALIVGVAPITSRACRAA